MIAKVLITFGVLFAAPFCMGLIPARFMPGGAEEKESGSDLSGWFFLNAGSFSDNCCACHFDEALGISHNS